MGQAAHNKCIPHLLPARPAVVGIGLGLRRARRVEISPRDGCAAPQAGVGHAAHISIPRLLPADPHADGIGRGLRRSRRVEIDPRGRRAAPQAGVELAAHKGITHLLPPAHAVGI